MKTDAYSTVIVEALSPDPRVCVPFSVERASR